MNAVTKYANDRLMQVLLAPQVSEKSTFVAEKNEQVVFRVASDATKPEIKAAVELLFKVQVESVQVLNVKGKEKRFEEIQIISKPADVVEPRDVEDQYPYGKEQRERGGVRFSELGVKIPAEADE